MTCTFETLESRRLLAGWAPASLEGWGFSCIISDGSYPYAEEGQFQFWPATSGNRYQLIGGPGVANSSGTYSYTRTSDNTGRFLVNDSLTGLSASQTLFFTAPTAGEYQLIGNGGFQEGTFTVLSMPPPPPAAGTISGSVFNDVNGNYNRTASEGGWAGVQVFLDSDRDGVLDVGESVANTDVSGAYTFSNVPVGSHLVRVQRPTNDVRATRGGFGITVNVQAGVKRTGIDFGLTTRSLISGIIFNDANSDNRRGVVETGRAGIRVYLDWNANEQYDVGENFVLSNAAGNYFLSAPPTGTVKVRAVTGQSRLHTVTCMQGASLYGRNFAFPIGPFPSGSIFSQQSLINEDEPGLAVASVVNLVQPI